MLKNIKKFLRRTLDPGIQKQIEIKNFIILGFRSVLGSQDLIFALATVFFNVFQHEVESHQIRTIVLADLIARSPELGERAMEPHLALS